MYASHTTVSTIAQFTTAVLRISDLIDQAPGSIWYRGMENGAYRLSPGVFRGRTLDETSIVTDFLVNLPIHVRDRTPDPWEIYALMQHHGAPTRLLDWSKSPLAALFFALDFDESRAPPDMSPVVYVMSPHQINDLTHGRKELFVPRVGFGAPEEAELIHSYLPDPLRLTPYSAADRHALPIAIEPTFSNPRLVAQSGCFTVHGTSSGGLDELSGLPAKLHRIDIKPSSTPKLRQSLEFLGLRTDAIYPDLDHLALRIKTDWVR